MHPTLMSQLTADRQASRIADADRQRLARQARAARKTATQAAPAAPAAPAEPARQPLRVLRLPVWLRHRVPA